MAWNAPGNRKYPLSKAGSSAGRTHFTPSLCQAPRGFWVLKALSELSLQVLTLHLKMLWGKRSRAELWGAWAGLSTLCIDRAKMHTQPLQKTDWFYWAAGRGGDTLIVIIMNSVMLVIINGSNRLINHSPKGRSSKGRSIPAPGTFRTPQHWTAWTHSSLVYLHSYCYCPRVS